MSGTPSIAVSTNSTLLRQGVMIEIDGSDNDSPTTAPISPEETLRRSVL